MGRLGGQLAAVRPDDLAAHVIRSLLERNPGLSPEMVGDVVWGAANQAGEDNRNVGRMAALLGGLGIEAPGQTVNRLCGSGMQAVITAAHSLMAGWGDVMVAGGSESMSRAPFVVTKPERAYGVGAPQMVDTVLGWRLVNRRMQAAYPPISLGETAEKVAYGLRRHPPGAGHVLADQPPEGGRRAGSGPLRRRDRSHRGALRAQEAQHDADRPAMRARGRTPPWKPWPSSGPSSWRAARSPPATPPR